ncbi:proteasome assembly chaperone 4-like [Halichondria panicea]|uniref:proteasome assembly chaperone 4-like n=1 Tax=Halichondria panicea TaxID=6063 RepID=UPI00312B8E99
MEEVITTKQFSKTLLGCEIHFYILRMKQSVLVWIGRISSFKHLSVAMKSRLDSQPISSQLIGDSTDTSSSNLSRVLALKGGCQCFVSVNIADESVRLLAEEHISELCVKHPELFSF